MTGHRGQVVAGGPPENSLAAVAAALDQGADGVEVDVRVSADGVAVCSHDPDLGRLAGVAALVRETAYAELARLRLPGGHRIARLDEVAHLVRGRGQLIVEVKVDAYAPARAAAATLAAVSRASAGLDLVVSSDSGAVLEEVRRLDPGVRRALVSGPRRDARAALGEVVAAGHHELHANLRAVLADHAVAERARHQGRTLRCWTVNRELDARLLEVAGVEGVISDDPTVLSAAIVKRRLSRPTTVRR